MAKQILLDSLYLYNNIRMSLQIFLLKVYWDFDCDCIESVCQLNRECIFKNVKYCNPWRRLSHHLLITIVSHFSHVWLFVTPWIVARQAPLFMGFSRQEHWSGLPFPSPGDLPNLGIKPHLLHLLHWQMSFFTTGATWGEQKESQRFHWKE